MFQLARQLYADALRRLRRNRAIERPDPSMAMHCRICGSDDVMRDAWAQWDENAQQWALGSMFDAAFCNLCEADTSLVEVPLASLKEMPA